MRSSNDAAHKDGLHSPFSITTVIVHTAYCCAEVSSAEPAAYNDLYLASSLLWLGGAFCLHWDDAFDSYASY